MSENEHSLFGDLTIRVELEILEYAVVKIVFCQACGCGLGVKNSVLLTTLDKKTCVVCSGCWDLRKEGFFRRIFGLGVIDGRDFDR